MWGYSWQNLMMLMASIPSMTDDKKDNKYEVIDNLDEFAGMFK